MKIQGIDHIQLAMPPGEEANARAFYRDLLGLQEVPKPAPLAGRGGCWFQGMATSLHLGVQEGFSPARKGHPAFLVENLATLRQRLESAGVAVIPDQALPGVRRFYAADPFGNRIEFIQDGDGFSQQREATPYPRDNVLEYQRAPFTISTDRNRLDLALIHAFLEDSYWAQGIPLSTVEESIRNALCYGVYLGERQVGFARLITDYATFAYLGDVFIIEAQRGQGLGKWLISCIRAHPRLQGLRRWLLATRDAHGLYAQYGFTPLRYPDQIMEVSSSTR